MTFRRLQPLADRPGGFSTDRTAKATGEVQRPATIERHRSVLVPRSIDRRDIVNIRHFFRFKTGQTPSTVGTKIAKKFSVVQYCLFTNHPGSSRRRNTDDLGTRIEIVQARRQAVPQNDSIPVNPNLGRQALLGVGTRSPLLRFRLIQRPRGCNPQPHNPYAGLIRHLLHIEDIPEDLGVRLNCRTRGVEEFTGRDHKDQDQ
ncbi:MAG: hypothetical protein DRJ65_10130 [Acidobacteria bacterium]|nr:MAG: hypothetical protein DRJ65_10130 [Acidobacteriota bacterium]